MTYNITVANPGRSIVLADIVLGPVPAGLTGVTWSCTSTGAAICTTDGTGEISDTVDLLAVGQVVFTASCTVHPSFTGAWDENTATVTAPSRIIDPNPAYNSATDSDLNPTIFRDGFESGGTST